MKNYETVSEAVNDLSKRGYTHDFNLGEDCLVCGQTLSLSPEEFEIDEVYRFEGMTDPGDEMIVYAIASKKGTEKGVLVNGYGLYQDGESSVIMNKLRIGEGKMK
ncbi:hypothetical protein GCM10027566_08220 [Arachidicoccus ginsenosidivorans]|uniref:Phosphoribosylpyrophosphate synthetase n=1 Tax=Arachidicoccus ginsenosidivorans TaxID=496057 RepID=A0A5B8VP81_9BACT|nr:phosphoribosylpyrophosphate synthetase [Arachidicoccus ginsenosidivorans]QEC73360.1 phosphoribosylpyrophosphate synthetase [Arachidicoccus ginsenosidivorans]